MSLHCRMTFSYERENEKAGRILDAFFFSFVHLSSSPEKTWARPLKDLSLQIRQHFTRRETHQRALTYVQGLMSSAERKKSWQVAEEVGETTPYAIQHLLDRARWDCDGVRDELRTSTSLAVLAT
jgi:hypothetical protein